MTTTNAEPQGAMWTIAIKTRKTERALELSPGVSALRAFLKACDEGAPGRYTLKSALTLLASADVKRDEMNITWRQPWVYWAMGKAGVLGINDVESFFAAEGAR